jgi:hypothetical protein
VTSVARQASVVGDTLDTPNVRSRMSRDDAVRLATVDLGTTLNRSLNVRVGVRTSWKAV